MTAQFLNPDNCWFGCPHVIKHWGFSTVVFTFRNPMPDMLPPMVFRRATGTIIRKPDVTGITDFASTPSFMWAVPGFLPQRFARGATFHDDIYRNHWVWKSYSDGRTWQAEAVTREWADLLLEEMIAHDPDPGSTFEQHSYLVGVRLGGWYGWGHGGLPLPLINETPEEYTRRIT